jgi:hypothetical protein
MDKVHGVVVKQPRVFGAVMNLKLTKTVRETSKGQCGSAHLNIRGNAVLVSHCHIWPDSEKM